MPRRSVALLALAAAAACFSDKGVDLSGTASGPVPSTSEAPDPGSTSTGADPTGTTAEPTTTTTTTLGETTAGPTCPDPQCEPGEVRDGAPCDICGVAREVCDQDCKWTAAGCADTDVCGHWTYDEKIGWQVQRPPPSEHAPKGPAAAAFDLTSEGQVVVLTASRYHVLSSDGAWIASGDVAALFPATNGAILQAMTTPGEGFYYVTVVAQQFAQIYALDPISLKTELFDEQPCCNSWVGISPPSLEAVRDVYVDLDNLPNWTALDPYALCEVDALPPIPYGAWFTADTVYIQDGYCDQMAYALPHAMFPPFAAPNAPPGAQIGGITLLGDRLYVFPGE